MHAMKPLFDTILNFDGFEFVAFWLFLFIILLATGFLIDWLMARQGFGPMLNAIYALLGVFIGLYLRYNYFTRAPWYGFEPYVTMGLIFGSIAILLLFLAVIRNRFWR